GRPSSRRGRRACRDLLRLGRHHGHQPPGAPVRRAGRAGGRPQGAGRHRPLRASFEHPASARMRRRHRRAGRKPAGRPGPGRAGRGAARARRHAGHSRAVGRLQRHRHRRRRRSHHPSRQARRRQDGSGLCRRRAVPGHAHDPGGRRGHRRHRVLAAQV
ncbi:hypothetical protein OY671_011819, partial [Metschnikowia pulcherrima]